MDHHYQQNKELKTFSRSNRKAQTDAEKFLWYKLRNRQIEGLKFRRQYPIDKYILDFYCVERKLAIELDGSQHLPNKEYDNIRTNTLQAYGIEVIRFWDNDVLRNIEGVLTRIYERVTLY